jgi:hypothetical protein
MHHRVDDDPLAAFIPVLFMGGILATPHEFAVRRHSGADLRLGRSR